MASENPVEGSSMNEVIDEGSGSTVELNYQDSGLTDNTFHVDKNSNSSNSTQDIETEATHSHGIVDGRTLSGNQAQHGHTFLNHQFQLEAVAVPFPLLNMVVSCFLFHTVCM
ncbi:PREDICTED: uncharacterized protein LOC104604353 [Nelumbo nucifera]|uniref:Uncharacterized protein LOC104604353 n=1 Tax=Nelumbo nucifera TaxID=4432 RepID=A0A1U8Q7A2_NELNU|nr:PREDICTED: uncharacterized protein LOC104604353 [Nelumbo nucifera]